MRSTCPKACALLLFLFVAAACSNEPIKSSPGASTTTSDGSASGSDALDSSTGGTSDGSATDGNTEATIGPGLGYVRVANLNVGIAGVDFCTSETSNFVGKSPLFASNASGVGPAQVSIYASAPTTHTMLRIVAAGATQCDTALVADLTIAVTDKAYQTLILLGTTAQDASGKLLVDKPATEAYADGGAGPLVRAVQGAPGFATLNVGTGSLKSGNFANEFGTLSFGGIATTNLGYRRFGWLGNLSASVPITADAGAPDGGYSDVAIWENFDHSDTVVGTLFLVADPIPSKVRALLCKRDTGRGTSSILNPECTLLARTP